MPAATAAHPPATSTRLLRWAAGSGRRWSLLGAVVLLATLASSAEADTSLPAFSCRASAAYVEVPGLLGATRVEPIQANGFPSSATPDRPQCATADQGVPSITLPPGASPGLQLTLQAPHANTKIDPEVGAARDQTATANAGTTVNPLTVNLGASSLVISATAVQSQAKATCVAGVPQLTGSSQIVALTINGQTINIPDPQAAQTIDIPALATIYLNRKLLNTTADGQELIQRAAQVVVPGAPAAPAINVVLAESKVDTHGAVCAPPPPAATCQPGSVAQPGSSPLVCVVTQTTPCPAGSAANPSAGGACTTTGAPGPCPQGTVRDPHSANCILILARPCPPGAQPDPATHVCVIHSGPTASGSGANGKNGSNGGIGSANGPRVTCGRISMHFVLNNKQAFTNQYGRRLVTRGRLVTCGAHPRSIVGARIDVVHILPGGKHYTKTGLRSRPGGLLTLILPLNLHSRTIEYSYRPNLDTNHISSRVNLRLTVRDRRGRVLR